MNGRLLEGLISEEDAAKEVRKTQRTLRRWRNQPDGPPYIPFGHDIFYDAEKFRAWIRAKERHPNPRRAI